MRVQFSKHLSRSSIFGGNGLMIGLFFLSLCITHSVNAENANGEPEDGVFEYQPATAEKSQLSLIEAVQLAIRNDPDIHIQKETSLIRKGELQTESGRFDASLVVEAEGEFVQDELTPEVRKAEEDKRIAARTRLDALEDANTQFNEILGEDRQVPEDGISEFIDTLIERDNQTRTPSDADAQPNQDELAQRVGLDDEVRVEDPPNDNENRPGTLFELFNSEDESLTRLTGDEIQDEENEVRDEPNTFLASEQRTELLDFQERLNILDTLIENRTDPSTKQALEAQRASTISDAQASLQKSLEEFDQELQDQRDEVEKLGSTPSVNVDSRAGLNLAVRYPLRNGVVVTPAMDVTYSGSQFRGKDQVDAPTYRSIWSLTVDLPLGKGRGLAARADEEAAKLVYQASLLTLKHTVSSSILNALNAYWTLVGAQERAELLKTSVHLQEQLVDLSKAQIDGDLIPKVAIHRVLAREAAVKAQWIRAEESVERARLALANQLGLNVSSLENAPHALDKFPALLQQNDLDSMQSRALIMHSLENRHDYKAARELQDSEFIRLEGTKIDLARTSDLQLEVGYTGVHQDANVGEGIRSALFGNLTGPSVRFDYILDWKINNDTARGQLASQEAISRQNRIITTNLERNIKNSVLDVFNSLKKTVQEVELGNDSTQSYAATMASELEKYKRGYSTLIDTILTEERVTNARLQLVTSKELYAKFIARLRFETATLFREDGQQDLIIEEGLTAVPSLAQAP